MIEIILEDSQSGYDAVGEYIRRYWDHNIPNTVVVSLGLSYNGKNYYLCNEVASPVNFDDIEFLYDWWEGEKFIKLYGIQNLNELEISGGIYTDD